MATEMVTEPSSSATPTPDSATLSDRVTESLEQSNRAALQLRDLADRWEAEARRAWEEADKCRALALASAEQARKSVEWLNRIHQYLSAHDLPTQILQICLELTGAEQGLFTSAGGDRLEAGIGLDALTHVPKQALLAFTREAAQKSEPVVENNGMALPDGPQLVNLAAVPVALHNSPAGVLLVANKRSGPFTDADTDTLLAVGHHAGTALNNQRLHAELNEAYLGTVAVLADAIMAKDPYTHGHSEGVSEMTLQVAKCMGIAGDDLDVLRYAALLHDVGKICVPDGILMKPSALSPEERLVIERHPQIGADMLSHVASLRAVAPIVRHHHEKMNGSGYPDGLSGEAIPLLSRIIAAVDAFDAMTTQRPYRAPITPSEALAELHRCAGEQFDPQVVAAITAAMEGAGRTEEVEQGDALTGLS